MRFVIVFSLLILTSCGASVALDYDKETDFAVYKSYNFYPSIASGLNDLDNKRIMHITDSLLSTKGLRRTENPQIYINFYVAEHHKNPSSTIGIGLGTGGRHSGISVGGGIPIGSKKINQQLTIDFIDVQKDALIWQAIGDGEMREKAKPSEKEAYYLLLLKKMFGRYPPKKK